MSTPSIASQLAKLRKERQAIEKKEKALLSKTNDQAVAQIKAIMKESGLSVDDLLAALKVSKVQKIKKVSEPKASTGVKAGFKVPIKYRHPTHQGLEWTGRGKTPVWIQELKDSGQLEQALVS
ncbi:MAG: H-NS histone family protein [Betaproteobacteria bacterium]